MNKKRIVELVQKLSERVKYLNEAPAESQFSKISKFVQAAYNAGRQPTKWDYMGMPAPKPLGIGTDPKKLRAGYEGSQMFWREVTFLNKQQAISLVKSALPNGYNNFDAIALEGLPDDVKVQFAREYSPCIYVKGSKPSKSALKADELGKEPDGTFRVWWD
jgi:hypothetical protein